MSIPALKMEVSLNEKTGDVRAAYLGIREGKVAKTREIKEGTAYADYDEAGNLLGIELLGPCDQTVLESLIEGESVQETQIQRRAIHALLKLFVLTPPGVPISLSPQFPVLAEHV